MGVPADPALLCGAGVAPPPPKGTSGESPSTTELCDRTYDAISLNRRACRAVPGIERTLIQSADVVEVDRGRRPKNAFRRRFGADGASGWPYTAVRRRMSSQVESGVGEDI